LLFFLVTLLFFLFGLVFNNLIDFFFEELHGITKGLDIFWQLRQIFRRKGFVLGFDFWRWLTSSGGSLRSLVNIIFELFDICSYDFLVLWLISNPLPFGNGIGCALDLFWGRSLLLKD